MLCIQNVKLATGMGDRGIVFRLSAAARDFSLLRNIQADSEVHTATGHFFPASKAAGRHVACSPAPLAVFNLLKPNDIYICRTAALTSRRYILNIYSTNIHTEYFKHAA